jgi:hypothetical protein
MRLRAAPLVISALVAVARPAHATDRLAVVFVADGDAATGDSVTEIAIARLAEKRGDLVGLRELRSHMGAPPSGETVDACLAAGRCLRELGEASSAEQAVIGHLTPVPEGWRLELGLAATGAGTVEWRSPRALPADMIGLAAGVRAALDELFPPAPPPGPPALSVVAPPRSARMDLAALGAPRARPVRASTVVGVGLAGLAVASLATAAALGHYADGMPTGATRADAQADLSDRQRAATATNVLLGAGGALAVAAGAILAWRW